jgi:hypothetical protein
MSAVYWYQPDGHNWIHFRPEWKPTQRPTRPGGEPP